jgi:hypothetical protein
MCEFELLVTDLFDYDRTRNSPFCVQHPTCRDCRMTSCRYKILFKTIEEVIANVVVIIEIATIFAGTKGIHSRKRKNVLNEGSSLDEVVKEVSST